MKVYWKVNIKNFGYFLEYILKRYESFKNNRDLRYFSSYYNGNKYLYLLIDVSDTGEYILSYTDYNIVDKKWLNENHWKDMGEFFGRKEKLVKLDNISKL